jgi:hypothetical protein
MADMDGCVSNLRLQVAALLDGMIGLVPFQEWLARAKSDIELRGSDAEVDLLDRVVNRLAEYPGGHITTDELCQVLRSDCLAYREEPALSFAGLPGPSSPFPREQRQLNVVQGEALLGRRGNLSAPSAA